MLRSKCWLESANISFRLLLKSVFRAVDQWSALVVCHRDRSLLTLKHHYFYSFLLTRKAIKSKKQNKSSHHFANTGLIK